VASGAVGTWAFVAPLGALVFYGPRQAVRWFGAFVALVAVSAAIDSRLPEPDDGLPAWLVTTFFALDIIGPAVTTFALLEYFVRSRDRAHRLLAAEQERSERLLLNTFPPPIVERLKISQDVIAERGEEVSVLFVDIVGFTPAAERLPAEEVVVLLNKIFSAFDELVAGCGLEKIKTIGDGFMAAAGLLHKVDDPIGRAVRCGLEMTSTLIDAHLGWEVRVGVHAGPVVAGVVGQERYQFDIWGDTVNVAARMVGMSSPGSVAATKEIFDQIASAFDGESLGMLEIKGKGEISVFGLRPRSA
jgi:guanylate cyclase